MEPVRVTGLQVDGGTDPAMVVEAHESCNGGESTLRLQE
jgi:hypothetical protein